MSSSRSSFPSIDHPSVLPSIHRLAHSLAHSWIVCCSPSPVSHPLCYLLLSLTSSPGIHAIHMPHVPHPSSTIPHLPHCLTRLNTLDFPRQRRDLNLPRILLQANNPIQHQLPATIPPLSRRPPIPIHSKIPNSHTLKPDRLGPHHPIDIVVVVAGILLLLLLLLALFRRPGSSFADLMEAGF